MKTREELFEQAFDLKEKTLFERKAAVLRTQDAARKANPRIVQIEGELSALGAQIAACVFSGDNERLKKIRQEMDTRTAERELLFKAAGADELVFDCAKCSDTGYVSGKICDCIKETVKGLRLSELADSFPIGDCRFDNFNLEYYPLEDDGDARVSPRKRMTAILKLCREYVVGFNPQKSENLLFMGGAGLGKTHLTLAMVSDLTRLGFDVVYSTAGALFSALEDEHFNLHTKDMLSSVLGCDLLVIDDLGSEFASSYSKSALYNIVNSRLLSGRPTIINTNLSMAEIERLYTARIASRFIGEYTAKKFSGRDIRQIRAMENKK